VKIVEPSVELLAISTGPAQLIELAGRTCYKSEDKITDDSASAFVAMVAKRGHESVIEHASATFRIVTDRGITHEIVRHRIASYSQESTRYCNYGKDKFGNEISVIVPGQSEPLTPEQYLVWERVMEAAEVGYFELLELRCKPQIARSVLPTCLKAEIVMTANFREWCHFLTLRMAAAAHPDMRPIALAVWLELVEHCEPVFGRFADLAASVPATKEDSDDG
jgi:thymidylate synthase (FAD)